jgi:hypothetical protein
MNGCDECTNRSVCILCKADYYFIAYQRNYCYYQINLDHYYKEGDAYFPCNLSLSIAFSFRCSASNFS